MGGGPEEGEEVEISSYIYKDSHGHDGFCRELFQLSGDEALDPGNVVLLLRVERLDNILSAMEGNPSTLERSNSCPPRPRQAGGLLSSTDLLITRSSSLKRLCKPTECVLDEVEEKGTLVERVCALEKRVLKLKRTLSTTLAGGNSLQEVADVEKHEVLTGTSIEEHDQYIREPQIRGEIPHREGHERIMLRGSTSTQVQEPTVGRQQPSKKKAKGIKKWLLKQFRMAFQAGTTQDTHCWNPHTK